MILAQSSSAPNVVHSLRNRNVVEKNVERRQNQSIPAHSSQQGQNHLPHNLSVAAAGLRPVKVVLERLTMEKIKAIQKSCMLNYHKHLNYLLLYQLVITMCAFFTISVRCSAKSDSWQQKARQCNWSEEDINDFHRAIQSLFTDIDNINEIIDGFLFEWSKDELKDFFTSIINILRECKVNQGMACDLLCKFGNLNFI